jgi:hypothetical protein
MMREPVAGQGEVDGPAVVAGWVFVHAEAPWAGGADLALAMGNGDDRTVVHQARVDGAEAFP